MSHMPVTRHTCLINSDGVGLSDGLISSTFLYFVIMLKPSYKKEEKF